MSSNAVRGKMKKPENYFGKRANVPPAPLISSRNLNTIQTEVSESRYKECHVEVERLNRIWPRGLVTLTAVLASWNLARADQVVKIGHAAPLTGQSASLGKDNENGARLAVEEINAKGFIVGGQKITLKLDAQDDEADPRTATQVAQKLVDDKVVAVVGHADSGTSIPASRIYATADVVQVSPSATNPAYTRQGFRTAY